MKPSQDLLTPENHSLALIDLEGQMAFATNSISIADLRANTAVVAGASKIFKIPTIVTTVTEETFSGPVFPEVEEFYPKASSNYIDRTSMNAWEDGPAYQAMISSGRKKIVMAGLWTSVCIVLPALSARAEGYDVYVITDVCGDISTEAHERAIQRMIQSGVIPITATQYILELQRDWARPETYNEVAGLIQKYGAGYGLGIQYAYKMLSH